MQSHGNYTPMTIHAMHDYAHLLGPEAAAAADAKAAVKHDSGKPDYALVPAEAIDEIAKAFSFGAKKYSANNWRLGFKWTRVTSALLRHTFAWLKGEDLDPESGLSHLAHAGACVCFLITFVFTKTGEDDRYKS